MQNKEKQMSRHHGIKRENGELLRKRRKGKMWSKVSPHLLVAGSDQEDDEDE